MDTAGLPDEPVDAPARGGTSGQSLDRGLAGLPHAEELEDVLVPALLETARQIEEDRVSTRRSGS
ncbi:hypothetical protein E4P41_11545 [Geodermatophilus sp. DF01-2]|uniref:hypothetical protein n=1 Tax=Geodermatophilus sp. DF01-2 TaxID=2559610 RepID=UPI0010734DA3|nr:hypothetical protein [Geodermatophilus sp. DF01_2]TFV59546.1 hypothetical protein E4P41_11545 [Geodermatophilus sp. DF01_2]